MTTIEPQPEPDTTTVQPDDTDTSEGDEKGEPDDDVREQLAEPEA